ncbi:glycoside hydrolase family 16 protein, partial [Laccaria amethystina LaAM-08-1]
GTPAANFPSTIGDFWTYFDAQNIIINLTLCGDWAGFTYSQGTGYVRFKDDVNYNVSAFTDVYFDFASIRVYQDSRKNYYRDRERQHLDRFGSFVVQWDLSSAYKLFENQLYSTPASRPIRCQSIYMNSKNICPSFTLSD